jgi:type II secretory pathway component GspD/PulD (secretin)
MMRAYSLALLLLLACGGGRSEGPGPLEADDVEIPWSDTRPARSGATESEPTRAGAADAPGRKAQSQAGGRIDFEVKDTDLHDAFRLLAETADINIVVADSVSGRLTLRVRQASWREVLQTIVNMKELELSEEGGIYYLR